MNQQSVIEAWDADPDNQEKWEHLSASARIDAAIKVAFYRGALRGAQIANDEAVQATASVGVYSGLLLEDFRSQITRAIKAARRVY